jgi:hypothetical protein
MFRIQAMCPPRPNRARRKGRFRRDISTLRDLVKPYCRTRTAAPFPLCYILVDSSLHSLFDGAGYSAAWIGGLLGGIIFGWFVARDVITVKPPIVRLAMPAALTAFVSAAAIGHVSRLEGLRFEVARFSKFDRQTMSAFNAALSSMQSGRGSPDDVAALVEARIFPPLVDKRARSERLILELQQQLAEVEQRDRWGRMARWRELEPSRKELARAVAFRQYLVERETDWRLRAEASRERAPNKMVDADHRDEVAANQFRAALDR